MGLFIFSFRFWGWVFLIILISMSFAAASFAEWHILPAIELEESHDSNIYLSPDNEVSDFITQLSPELNAEEVSATRTFSAHYILRIVKFKRHTDDNYVGHSGDLSWDQQLTQNLSWHIREGFDQSEEPLEENPEITAVRRTRNKYSRNTVDTGFTYQFGEEDRVTASYLDSRLWNKDPTIEDDVEYGPSLELEYWLGHRHGFTLGYSWSQIEYKVDPPLKAEQSNKTEDLRFGYQWRWSPHTTLHLDYGLELFSSQDPAEEDYDVHSVMVGFDHDLGPLWTMSSSLGFFYMKPENSSSNNGDEYSFTLSRRFATGSISINGDGGYRLEYTDAENRGFTKYKGVSLSATHSMSPRTEIYTTISYLREEYSGREGGSNRDNTWDISLGTSYQILSWLSAVVELTQRERSSSGGNGGYRSGGYGRYRSGSYDEYRDSLVLFRLRGTYEWR